MKKQLFLTALLSFIGVNICLAAQDKSVLAEAEQRVLDTKAGQKKEQEQKEKAKKEQDSPKREQEPSKSADKLALPAGSYKMTCTDCTVNGNTLSCKCRNSKGKTVDASLDLKRLSGSDEVTNCDGELRPMPAGKLCDSAVYPTQPPAGSYQKTCKDCVMKGAMVKCSCKNKSGKYADAEYNVTQVPQGHEIANCDAKMITLPVGKECPVK